MGHRLSKIYTRTGDDGSTGLGDGSRVAKDSQRMQCIGIVDELNSGIGLVRAHNQDKELDETLSRLQHQLFDLGGELSIPGHSMVNASTIDWLEKTLDGYNEQLPMLQEFILPAGGPATASCHLARSICRRAERQLVTLQRDEDVSTVAMQYLNRLSDLLFVLARVLARAENGTEVLWQRGGSDD